MKINYSQWPGAIFAAFLLAGCGKRPPSYESRFEDCVLIDLPPGRSYENAHFVTERIDEILRSRKVGFCSGVMRDGKDIDFISLDLDFESVDEAALIQSLIEQRLIPEDAEIKYRLKEVKGTP